MKVAIYLRVSTLDQATKGNTNRDGFSIPAQREACRRKAKELGATQVKEFVDRGESARSAARPGLQLLLQDLCDKKKLEYVIVHKIDRLARNLHDDVMIGLAIKKGGAQLVSVTENIDDTPSGQLLHGIMAAIAEFYSRNLAAEALKGATEKAKQGGTPYQAPIGYVNVIERINRREVRTVALDQKRAPLVRWAFERYATGDYGQRQLCEALARRGLRSRIRKYSTVAPLSLGGLNKMLMNRYYMGYLTYCGVEYKGKHQPIVTPSVFAAVQMVRLNHLLRDNKHRQHFHYLSRLLLCGRCGRHLCYSVHKNRYGVNYYYYFCLNRKDHLCDLVYVPVAKVEDVIVGEFKKLKFSDSDRRLLVKQVGDELNSEQHFAETEVKQQRQRLNSLLAERENLLQAYYDKVIQADLLKSEQRRIAHDIKQAESVIKEAEKRLTTITFRKDRALALAQSLDFAKAYQKANPAIKRHFCLAFFSKAAIDDHVTIQKQQWRAPCHHYVEVTKVIWHEPMNIHPITEAILALSLQRRKKAAKKAK
ncbi:MAG: recombinase family protein [Candidatus Saccharimonadales bacterium]